jgi:hydrogenase maturation protease
MARTLILGIGNVLLSDEGAGIHLLEHLRTHHPNIAGVEYLDGGTLGFTLATEIEDAENLIVLDAAHLNARPGAMCCLVGMEMDTFLGSAKRSAHEVGLLDLLDMARLTETLPRNRALVGIQPGETGWGDRRAGDTGGRGRGHGFVGQVGHM